MSTGNQTLDRIQQEIQEALEREEELKRKYSNKMKNNLTNGNTNGFLEYNNNNDETTLTNGDGVFNTKKQPLLRAQSTPLTNGHSSSGPLTNGNSSNNIRRFTPNPSAKGVMHKFLKTRGKLSLLNLKSSRQTQWVNDAVFEPTKMTVEKGKPVRNGYISAEEKMKKELQEFQLREDELRKERRKSQPDLMAALEAEEMESNLRPAKSLAKMYNSTENLLDEYHSAPASLRPSRSLAQLCDADDEEAEMPGTHSLIMQFENLKMKNVQP